MKPFIKWAGGKRWLVEHDLLREVNFSGKYLEPFLGGGAMFFHLHPKVSVLSDLNHRLIETYIAIQKDPSPIKNLLKTYHESHDKKHYYVVRELKLDTIEERAAQFLYLNRTCWNGLYRENLSGIFNVPVGTKTSVFDPMEDFEKISSLLRRADIICRDFEVTIDMAVNGDFVFCDPPYTTAHNLNGFLKYNQQIFSWDDQIRLKNAAFRAVERGAKVLISNANHPSLHDLYKDTKEIIVVNRNTIISGSNTGRKLTSEILVNM